MRFKIDENLPAEVAAMLQAAGHDAISVLDQRMGGQSDASVAAACQQEERALITLDLGFADIRRYPPQDYAGLIVLRLQRQDKGHALEVLDRLVHLLAREPLPGHLWIVDEHAVRVHRGPHE